MPLATVDDHVVNGRKLLGPLGVGCVELQVEVACAGTIDYDLGRRCDKEGRPEYH